MTSDLAGDKRGAAESSAEPRFLAVGRVLKPHGVRGEVRVEPLTDDPARFKQLTHIYVGERNPRRVAIEGVRFHQSWVLLRLDGYPTRTEAELLRNELLQVTEAEAVPLEEGEYYLYQLEGLAVYTEAGVHLGRLTDVLETGANNVFIVQGPKGELLIPDIPDVVQDVDIAGGRLVIRPLPGLLGDMDE
ncbi:ribosome maturation factor RimM [Promineifilum sp.]|uniref:ribosome maturation factor RimM n=1 Tax=Promineifilum sp. TaxID=2664178 RepID=UPI0035B1E087